MDLRTKTTCLILLFLTTLSFSQNRPPVTFSQDVANKKIDVLIDGKLFTSYWWPDTLMKPVLYPVFTPSGKEITRGYPIAPRPGDRADHPHHVGIWLNYGNVNGVDFWGNSYAQPLERRQSKGGRIANEQALVLSEGDGEGKMSALCTWKGPGGQHMLYETTTFHIIAQDGLWILDRTTILAAGKEDMAFNDTKEGMYAIRLRRELELPSKGRATLIDDNGKPQRHDKDPGNGVSGDYLSSEDVTGGQVWGTRARWMRLSGTVEGEKVSVAMIDHPDNPNYPTYWHARGYGLFSLNPFGVKDFTKGKEELNFILKKGEKVIMKYRLVVFSGEEEMSKDEIDKLADEFGRK